MSEPYAPVIRPQQSRLPKAVGIPLILALILFFILLDFPWDTLARRLAWEISAASGSRVSIDSVSPALTGRGPVLRALNVTIEHPAVDRVRLSELEVAPRLSTSWLHAEPALRVWAQTDLGGVDGVLELGESPSYVGHISGVELARLPLRLEATGLRLSGLLDADAEVALNPAGTLHGRIAFVSPSLVLESDRLPMAIPFTSAAGTIVILEDGATQIESVALAGPLVEGNLSGEIGLVHHSNPSPISLKGDVKFLDPSLRQLAPSAGFQLGVNGEAKIQIQGTLAVPRVVTISPRGIVPGQTRTRPVRPRNG